MVEAKIMELSTPQHVFDTEITIKYNYLTGLYQFLLGQASERRMRLQKSPGNVIYMAELEKINHDTKLLEPLIRETQKRINLSVQEETGGTFKFIQL